MDGSWSSRYQWQGDYRGRMITLDVERVRQEGKSRALFHVSVDGRRIGDRTSKDHAIAEAQRSIDQELDGTAYVLDYYLRRLEAWPEDVEPLPRLYGGCRESELPHEALLRRKPR